MIPNIGVFPWGKKAEWFEIGPYTILSYYSNLFEDNFRVKGKHEDKLSYHGWIDGNDTNESWPSLESAIVGLIGRKYAGPNNGGVGYYFCKMIDAPPFDKKAY